MTWEALLLTSSRIIHPAITYYCCGIAIYSEVVRMYSIHTYNFMHVEIILVWPGNEGNFETEGWS